MIRFIVCCFVFICFVQGFLQHDRKLQGKCCNRIVGGVDTDISEVPYQAALLWGNYYFCGAAIVSDKFVVTGAHCILFLLQMSDSDDDMVVRIGSNYSEKGGIVVKSKNTTCHPKFDFDNYDYDICLIELETSLKFNENIQPITLGIAEPNEGQIGKVAGWGTLWEGGSLPEKLQSVSVPVTNKAYCKKAYEKISPITDRMFCAGEEGKDSCQGDSGGGLAIDNHLVGIISTGFGCGLKNYPGVYTSVAHPEIANFVKEVTNISYNHFESFFSYKILQNNFASKYFQFSNIIKKYDSTV